jgi:hypothetical protein
MGLKIELMNSLKEKLLQHGTKNRVDELVEVG